MSGLLFPAQRVCVDKPPTLEERTAIQNGLDEWPTANDAMKQLVALGCDVDTDKHCEPDTIRKWWANNAKKFADTLLHR